MAGRHRRRPPDFAPSSELLETTSGRLSSKGTARLRDVPLPPAPGGEPLWHVPGHPVIFVSTLIQPKRVKTGGSRERPSAMYSLAAFDRLHPDRRDASRWVVSGSRLLRHFLDRSHVETKIVGSPYTFQSGSPPGAGDCTSREAPPPRVRGRLGQLEKQRL